MDLSEIMKAIRRGLTPLAARDPLRLSEWAAQHFYLSAESSYVEQKWEAYPYQIALMDAISNDDIREVWVRKSARVGYTKILLASLGYFAEHKHRNQAIWQPTDDDSDDFVKTELEPMLRDVEAMREVFPQYLARDKKNTLKQKKFLDSILHTKGGKAAKNYRRISVDCAFLDELDAFDGDVEKEGDPVSLAKKRTEGATFPKIVGGTTPKLKGFSLIEGRCEQAKARYRFHVPCPHCDEFIMLTWGGRDNAHGFKWVDGDPDTVQHLCPSCASLFTQADYLTVWQRGRWQDETGGWIDNATGKFYDSTGALITPPESVAFHVWTAYSPQASWADIVREFLAANSKAKAGDKSGLKTFTNTTLGETWEEEVEKTDTHALQERAEQYPLRRVPLGGLVLAAGVDVQGDRFEVVVYAFGRGEEMWVIDYQVIHANPADETDWDLLDNYLLTVYPHVSGATLKIEAAAVDTGGHFTHQAYNFCRLRKHRKIFAIKGETKQGQPIKGRASMQDVNWRGKTVKNGVKLWLVGTDTAKDLLHGRLQLTQPGPGYVHFSKELPDVFYQQLTAEVRMLAKTSSGDAYRWVKRQNRNEVLDCTVYAIFCAHALELHRYPETMWRKLTDSVQPVVADLFAVPAGPPRAETVAGEVPVKTDAAPVTQANPASAGFFVAHEKEWLGQPTDDWLS